MKNQIAEQTLYNMLYNFDMVFMSPLGKQVFIDVIFPVFTAKSVLYYQLEPTNMPQPPQIQVQQDRDGTKQIQLNYTNSMDLVGKTFTAWLDVLGDGSLVIPCQWENGQWLHKPQTVTILPENITYLNQPAP